MNRIDVVPVRDVRTKGFKVLINFIQHGIVYHSPQLANQEAEKVHDQKYPSFRLNLIVIEEMP